MVSSPANCFTLKEGNFLGHDLYPLYESYEQKEISVSSESMIGLCLPKYQCRAIFGQRSFGETLLRNHLLRAIERNKILNTLEKSEQAKLVKIFEECEVGDGEVVLEKGTQISEKLVYLLRGNLVDIDGNILLEQGNFIGEQSQFEEEIINEYFQEDHIMDDSGDGNGDGG